MFFTLHVLSRKGSLGTVWIAAHLDKKLKRQQISDTDIRQSVAQIMNPEAPFALRLSGQLLFGLVRVYRRQVSYLLQDCNDALSKLHNAFLRTTLPEIDAAAALKSSTLAEDYFQLDEIEMDQLYGLLADHNAIQMQHSSAEKKRLRVVSIFSEENDLLVEAVDPPRRTENGSIAWSGIEFGRESILRGDDREIPPIENIPLDDLQRDVLRDRQSYDQQRLSSISQIVQTEDLAKNMRMTLEQSSDYRISSPQRMLEMDKEVPKTPDKLLTEPPLMLPQLHYEDLAPCGELENVPTPEIDASIDKSVVNVTAEPRLAPNKHRAVIDKDDTVMSDSVYRKMLKEAGTTLVKERKIYMTDGSNEQMDAIALDVCSVSQIALSSDLQSVWLQCLQKSIDASTDHSHQQQSATDDNDIEQDVENSLKDTVDYPSIDIPRLQSIAEEEIGALNLEGLLNLSDDELPANEALLPDEEATDAFPEETIPEVDTLPEGYVSPKVDDEFTRESQKVLTHLKRRLSERLSLCNDSEPTIEAEDFPSPKKRRLSSNSELSKDLTMFEIMNGRTRQQASRWFYEMLVLKSRDLMQLKQSAPYADITISDTQWT